MNKTAIELPLTDADQQSLAVALSTGAASSAGARIAGLKMIYTVAANAHALGITADDICEAVSAGAEDWATVSLFEVLAFEVRFLTVYGALLIQAAGVIQVISWIENAASWLMGMVGSMATFFTSAAGGVASTVVSGALNAFQALFGSASNQTKKDAFGRGVRHDSNALCGTMNAFTMMAAAEAPALSALMSMLGYNSGTATPPTSAGSSTTPSQANTARGSGRGGAFRGAGSSRNQGSAAGGGGLSQQLGGLARSIFGGGGGGAGGGGSAPGGRPGQQNRQAQARRSGGGGGGGGARVSGTANFGGGETGTGAAAGQTGYTGYTGYAGYTPTFAGGSETGGTGGTGFTGYTGGTGGTGATGGTGYTGYTGYDRRRPRRRDAGIATRRQFVRHSRNP